MPKLTPGAKKQLGKLPPQLSAKAHELIRRLDEPHLGKKLVGPLKGKRSARLGRSHRIIYQEADGYIVVLTVGPRKDVYR
ncbi:MAG: type II toxin-antitoxin system RelE/ParE family toxin [bacterium]|nr:type II toxin-antitoxin system RelE/ParE family toxin [bacterium]